MRQWQKTATVAEFGDSRRNWRLSPVWTGLEVVITYNAEKLYNLGLFRFLPKPVQALSVK